MLTLTALLIKGRKNAYNISSRQFITQIRHIDIHYCQKHGADHLSLVTHQLLYTWDILYLCSLHFSISFLLESGKDSLHKYQLLPKNHCKRTNRDSMKQCSINITEMPPVTEYLSESVVITYKDKQAARPPFTQYTYKQAS